MGLDYQNPQKYFGEFQNCYIGYSAKQDIRENAASGGVVTTMLVFMLEKGYIDGAFISRQEMIDGKVSAKSFIATTKEEIINSATSIYVNFPLVKYFDQLQKFEGRLAVVALPCQLHALDKYIEKHTVQNAKQKTGLKLQEKIVLKISLFCSGTPTQSLVQKILTKNKVNSEEVDKVYFRKGHWRGNTHLSMKDGTDKEFSYLYNICTYKNLYYEMLPRCLSCSNHFGYSGDICCGDVWLKEMKANPIKHTGFVVKSIYAQKIIDEMISEGNIVAEVISPEKVLKSQKRALNFKFLTAAPRNALGDLFNIKYNGTISEKHKWNHFLAAFLILLNVKMSKSKVWSKIIFMIPRKILFLYMGFIRVLLNK